MPALIRRLLLVAVAAAVLGLMWYQAFEVTGVTSPVVPPGVERPAPPDAPHLAPLPTEAVNLERFRRDYPVWSALPL